MGESINILALNLVVGNISCIDLSLNSVIPNKKTHF